MHLYYVHQDKLQIERCVSCGLYYKANVNISVLTGSLSHLVSSRSNNDHQKTRISHTVAHK